MAKSKKPADEPAARKRGRPPGARNKKPTPGQKLQELRVEKARRMGPKKRAPSVPAVQESIVYAEEVEAGERFGEGPRGQAWQDVNVDAPDPGDANGQWSFLFPRRRGRKAKLNLDGFTLDRIWDCGVRKCTMPETAVALAVSVSTLEKFFLENPSAQAVWEDSQHAGNGSLRSEYFTQALSGNTPVLLHAAKHYLGMGAEDKTDPGAVVSRERIDAAADELNRRVLDLVARKRAEPVPSGD